jgi:hypothetical protein
MRDLRSPADELPHQLCDRGLDLVGRLLDGGVLGLERCIAAPADTSRSSGSCCR